MLVSQHWWVSSCPKDGEAADGQKKGKGKKKKKTWMVRSRRVALERATRDFFL